MRHFAKLWFSLILISVLLLGFSGSILRADDSKSKDAPLVPKVIAIDTTGNGKPDRWEYYENGKLVRIEADTNGDGKVDEWAEVKDGKIVSAKKDTKGTGKPDRWISY